MGCRLPALATSLPGTVLLLAAAFAPAASAAARPTSLFAGATASSTSPASSGHEVHLTARSGAGFAAATATRPQIALLPRLITEGSQFTATVTAPARSGTARIVALQIKRATGWVTVAHQRTTARVVRFTRRAGTIPALADFRGLVRTSASRTALLTVTGTGLHGGQRLAPGTFLTSADGRYRVTMQWDGNLVETVASSGRALWASGTDGHAGAWAVQQGDGNLVVYSPNNVPLWSSRTGGHTDDRGWFAGIQPDANFVVYDSGKPYWADSAVNNDVGQHESLKPGWYVRAPNGRYTLTMQGDGNLVETVTSSGRPLWASNTAGHPGAELDEQTDGNLVIYVAGKPLWASNTNGTGTNVAIQNDANLVQYASGGAPLWASSTENDTIFPGESLEPGQSLSSVGGAYLLVMQGDGNLVQYHGSSPTWASNTGGHPGAHAVMQGDGNFVVYLGGTPLWATGTGGDNGAYVANQTDGNIVVYLNGVAKWASHSGGGPVSGGGSCSDGGPGVTTLAGNAWLGGQGVPVCGNGGSSSNDWGRHYTNGVYDGDMWQCVELVNRLYLARGWIHTTWWGNGNQMYANAPAGLSRQPNGSISYLSPGDVVSFSYGNSPGHAAVVASVSGSSVTLVNQNASVYSYATLSGGQLTMQGWAGYVVIGVIHHP